MTTEQISRHFIAVDEDLKENLDFSFNISNLPVDSSLKMTIFDPTDLKNSICLLFTKYDDATILAALFNDKEQEFKKDHTTTMIRNVAVSVSIYRTSEGVEIFQESIKVAQVIAKKLKLIISVWSDVDVERDFSENVTLSRRLHNSNAVESDDKLFPQTPDNKFVRRELVKRQQIQNYNIRILAALLLLLVCVVLIITLSITTPD
ncbi:hypothetical protein [Fig virus B]|uniref:p23 n=1 Tax=Fig closterovirus 1 TaxID=2809010 RepID=A0A8A0XUQ9_9CLOS|nr:hypothetical protein [Fig virus B]QSQ86312.1 p23 [Fig closterovirus 1]